MSYPYSLCSISTLSIYWKWAEILKMKVSSHELIIETNRKGKKENERTYLKCCKNITSLVSQNVIRTFQICFLFRAVYLITHVGNSLGRFSAVALSRHHLGMGGLFPLQRAWCPGWDWERTMYGPAPGKCTYLLLRTWRKIENSTYFKQEEKRRFSRKDCFSQKEKIRN